MSKTKLLLPAIIIVNPEMFDFIDEDDSHVTQYPSIISQKDNINLNLQIKKDDAQQVANGIEYVFKQEARKSSHRGSVSKIIPNGPAIPLLYIDLNNFHS